MAIDLNAEKDKIIDEHGKVIGEYLSSDKLLALVARRGDLRDFDDLIRRYGEKCLRLNSVDLTHCKSLFGPRWMARFERPHLEWICRLLVAKDSQLKFTERLVADRRIAAERRALCFHVVFSARTQPPYSSGLPSLSPPRLWGYNRDWWDDRLTKIRQDGENAIIRRLGCAKIGKCVIPDSMRAGAEKDAVGAFEINRTLENRLISDSLLQFLIDRNAANCFKYFLAEHPQRVFKLRSPQEWLLTVCRCAKEKLAVAAADELERQFPGIVAATRDPWGRNALWSTFCEPGPKEKLREELIRLGCDPDAEDEFGLSYRLLRDNAPQSSKSLP